jgi:ABC-2 type transport system permease protein
VKALWIALANLRRMFRTRANIFFAFVFPMLLILVLGATFGGSSTPRLGVVSARSGPLGAALVRQLQRTPQLKVVSVADRARPRSSRPAGSACRSGCSPRPPHPAR